jgi:hypothetical protein
MRKSGFILFFLLSAITVSYAQYPEAGTTNFTFGINGLNVLGLNTNIGHTGSLLFKYFKTDDFAYRFSAGINYANNSNSNSGSGKKTMNSGQNFAFIPGFGLQKNIVNINHFNIYYGADFVAAYSYTRSVYKSETTDSTQVGGKNGDFTQTITLTPSKFSLGLYPLLGFNYFFNKNFALGAEFNVGMIYGFAAKRTITSTNRVNGIDYPAEVDNTGKSGPSFNFSTSNGALITLGIYF